MRFTVLKALFITLTTSAVQAGDVTVFAAASLKTAFDELAEAYSNNTGHNVTLSVAGSAALARQIQLGAPADVFVSANVAWMDVLEDDGLIKVGTRFDMAGNRLVLIGHGEQARRPIDGDLPLKEMLGDGYLAMGFVGAVPAGIYGKAALENLNLWDDVQGRIAQSDSVRGALALVATGEAPLGVVYRTDAAVDGRVSIIGVFPDTDGAPITYPAAAVTDAGRDFIAYLQGATAQEVLQQHGFDRIEVQP